MNGNSVGTWDVRKGIARMDRRARTGREVLNTSIYPLLTASDIILLEDALILFLAKRHLPPLPPATSMPPPSVLCRFCLSLQAPRLCSTSILPRAERTPVPHRGTDSPWSFSDRSPASGFLLPRHELHREGFLFHSPPSKSLFGPNPSRESR